MKIKDNIKYEDFNKLDLRIGRVVEAEIHPDADKLLVLKLDFGETIGTRQILTALREFYGPEDFFDKKIPCVINMEPRKIRGMDSEGMIMAIDEPEKEKPTILEIDKEVLIGSLLR